MALPAIVGAIAAGIEAAPGVVAGIESVLDTLIGRSILFEVKNVTDEPLRIEMDGGGHGAGGFSAPPPHQINPYEAVVFASRNTGDLHGSLRLVGANVWFGMSFSNPVVGSNQLRSSVNGARAAEFGVHAVAGRGEKKARFAYVTYYSDVQRTAQGYKAHTEKRSGSTSPSVSGPPVKAIGKARPSKKKIDPERLKAAAEHVLVQQPLLKKRPKK